MVGKKQKFTLDCKVDSYRSGWSVVEFLSHRFPYHPPSRWTERVADGRVLVNGARIHASQVVNERDLVTYSFFHSEPEVDFTHTIAYEDDDLFVVSKSGNLPCHACGVYIKSTLITYVKQTYGDHINLAHRLDRETSGLVVMSKNPTAARELGRMFAHGEMEKSYVAVVHGHVAGEAFTVDAPIAKSDAILAIEGARETMRGLESDLRDDMPNFVPKRVVDFEKGKPAVTDFSVIRHGEIAGDGPTSYRFSILEARPRSGRTNQIRVHLHHAGHPILGDKVYGAPEALPLTRQALHCISLAFRHPTTGEPLRLTAALPGDLARFADTAR